MHTCRPALRHALGRRLGLCVLGLGLTPTVAHAALISDTARLPSLPEVLDLDAALDLDGSFRQTPDTNRLGVHTGVGADLFRFRADDPADPANTAKQSRWYLGGRLGLGYDQAASRWAPDTPGIGNPSSLAFDLDLLGSTFLGRSDLGIGPGFHGSFRVQGGPAVGPLLGGGLFGGATLLHRTYNADRRKQSELLVFAGLGGQGYAAPCRGSRCPVSPPDDEDYGSDDGDGGSVGSDSSGSSGGDDGGGDVGLWATSRLALTAAPADQPLPVIDGTAGTLAPNLLVHASHRLGPWITTQATLDLRGLPREDRLHELAVEASLRLQLTAAVSLLLTGRWEQASSGSALQTFADDRFIRYQVGYEELRGLLGLSWDLH